MKGYTGAVQNMKPLTWGETFSGLPKREYLQRFNAEWAKAGVIDSNYLQGLDGNFELQEMVSKGKKRDLLGAGIGYGLSGLGIVTGADSILVVGAVAVGTGNLISYLYGRKLSGKLWNLREKIIRYALGKEK